MFRVALLTTSVVLAFTLASCGALSAPYTGRSGMPSADRTASDTGSAKTPTSFTSLFSFDGTDGESPRGALVQATNGNFYGTTVEGGASGNCADGCGTVFKIAPGGTQTVLHSFDGTDGSSPNGVIQAT
ncbi:MAG: choice-of-anchor tandem repeat GloVer-containing protein, partial [Bryobacteraceae bacterium]